MSTTVFVDLIEVPPLEFVDYQVQYGSEDAYRAYLDKFRPWRWVAKNAANHKKLARSSERYFNATDARNAIDQLFGPDTICYLRASEKGNELLRHPEPWPAA